MWTHLLAPAEEEGARGGAAPAASEAEVAPLQGLGHQALHREIGEDAVELRGGVGGLGGGREWGGEGWGERWPRGGGGTGEC
jgi:hypothetical protein